MKTHDVTQGTEEWFKVRSGMPTASNFGMILSPTGKKSTQAKKYIDTCLAEYLANDSINEENATFWMERGNLLEDEARKQYSFVSDREVREVGFCTLDNNSAGYSPDGFSEEGLIELKCPKHTTLVSYYRDGFPNVYKPQCQGGLWITGKAWIDFFAYHPKMTPYSIRIERDEAYISLLEEAVQEFNAKLEVQKTLLEEWKVI